MNRFLIPLAWLCAIAFGVACWLLLGLFVAWVIL